MATGSRSTGRPLLPGLERPAVISHAGGNNAWRVDGAIAQGADLIEVDLWERAGRFEARHERRVGGLPFLYEKWYFRRPDAPFDLADLLRATDTRARLFLDFKNGGIKPVHLLRDAIDAAEPWLVPAASSQTWGVLRHIRRHLPEVPVYYSIDVPAQLDLLMENLRREEPPDGVSCRHSLLDAGTIRMLHRAGMAIVAWTVDDPARARELVDQGVAAITTHEVEEIRDAIKDTR